MLKIIFLSLFLSTYSFANDEKPQTESGNAESEKIFKKSSLTMKDSKEDNINVLPFYTVKELKDSKKEEIKINKEEIKTLNQFKIALADKKKKLEDAESTLKYFQEMYAGKKLDNKRTVLELKWSLRVIAKRKDAIVRLNKRYKQSIDLTSLDLDQYQSEIESEKSGKDLMEKLESEKSIVRENTEIIKSRNTVINNGPVVTGNIQKDQQAAYKFYKNKTYKDVISNNKNKKAVVSEIVQPQAIESKALPVEPAIVQNESKVIIEQPTVVDSMLPRIEIPQVIAEQKKESPIANIQPAVVEDPKTIIIQKNEIDVSKPLEPIVDKKEIVDQLEVKPDVILDAKAVEIIPTQQPTSEDSSPKKEEITTSVTESAQLKETLEIVNLKMSQQKIEQEYKNLLEKYKQLELDAKEKEAKQALKDESSVKNKEVEKPSKIVIIDEKASASAENKEEIGKVKINSIKEQLNGDVGSQESHVSGDNGSDKDEDVMYYRGNGIEEEGSMEESEGPAY